MRHLFIAAVFVLTTGGVCAQSEGLLQIGDEVHQYLERQVTLGNLPDALVSAQPLSTYEARALLDSLAQRPELLSSVDRRLLDEFRGERVAGALAGLAARAPVLYQDGRTFLHHQGDDFGIEASPLANIYYGPAHFSRSNHGDEWTGAWQNSRGVRLAGRIGGFFAETRVEENQRFTPISMWADQTAPRLGWTRRTASGMEDYLVATGIAGYRSRYFEGRFGRDRNHWGFGRSSLIMSNYATVYDQLQLRWRVWRLEFTSVAARFLDPPGERVFGDIDVITTQRFGAFHRIAMNLPAGFQVEIFESVMFAQDTTGTANRGPFEIAYLNPFIFYRAAEHSLGSPDNVALGGGLSWRPTSGLRLYSQVRIDELRLSEFFNDWWGNKWGYMMGAQIADPGFPGLGRINNLDLRVEYARLRPYLYSHIHPASAYIHYGDVFGHPAGPNASDLTLSARYQPVADLTAQVDFAFTRRGRGTDTMNVGADPTQPNTTRTGDEATTLQGIRQDRTLLEAQVAYRLLPQAYSGIALRALHISDDVLGTSRYVAPQVFLRWGLPFASDRY